MTDNQRIFRKGDVVRVVETQRDAVAAAFDGFREAVAEAVAETPKPEAPKPEAPKSGKS